MAIAEKNLIAAASLPGAAIYRPGSLRESRPMTKADWGTKRICQSCGAKYYDLKRTPIVCPKCGTAFDPDASLRARKVKAPKPAKAAPAARPDDDEDEVESEEEETAAGDDEEEGEVSLDAMADDELADDDDDEDEDDEANFTKGIWTTTSMTTSSTMTMTWTTTTIWTSISKKMRKTADAQAGAIFSLAVPGSRH